METKLEEEALRRLDDMRMESMHLISELLIIPFYIGELEEM